MLTRIISGAVGVAIMAVVLYFHNTIVLPIAVAAMIAVMLYELLRAVKLEKCIPILSAVELCGIITPFLCNMRFSAVDSRKMSYSALYHYSNIDDYVEYYGKDAIEQLCVSNQTSLIAFAVTLLATFVIFITWLKKHKEIRYEQVFFALAVMILVPQSMSTMVRIDRMDREMGLLMLILGLCGAWIADTGAYFTGVAFGKYKLCPEISPKKTIEGFIGGIVTTGIVFAVIPVIYNGRFQLASALILFIIGAVCAIVGTIGDLSASMVKRQIGFKDYGKIMPGHGGLMDRFDSVLFVLPAFYAMMALLEFNYPTF